MSEKPETEEESKDADSPKLLSNSMLKSLIEKEVDYRKFGIQDYLSLGYLYLLILGIITEVVYYKFVGVNILYYSGLMDVILSPIIFLTKRTTVFVTFLLLLFFVALLDRHKRKAEARNEAKEGPSSRDEKLKNPVRKHPKDFFLKMSAAMVFFMFIGGGIGAGIKQRQTIYSKDFECLDVVEFMDGESIRVRVVGQNNDFLFCVRSNQTNVTVVPLRGNVKSLGRLPKDIADKESIDQEDADKKETRKSRNNNPNANN